MYIIFCVGIINIFYLVLFYSFADKMAASHKLSEEDIAAIFQSQEFWQDEMENLEPPNTSTSAQNSATITADKKEAGILQKYRNTTSYVHKRLC